MRVGFLTFSLIFVLLQLHGGNILVAASRQLPGAEPVAERILRFRGFMSSRVSSVRTGVNDLSRLYLEVRGKLAMFNVEDFDEMC